MASLTIGNGTKVVAERGNVGISGGCVLLFSVRKDGNSVLQVAYKLQPGERVQRIGDGEDYSVEL